MKAFLIFAFTIVAGSQTAFASCGLFEVSKGDVKIRHASDQPIEVAVGAKICSGDAVITGESARAKIKMEDGNELNISPNSKIVIETYQYDMSMNKKKVMLNVLQGKVRATTREENMYTDTSKDGQANTFQVRTKSAVAGVRGTDFLTSFDAKSARMEVVTFRGKVEVGLPGPAGTILNSVQVSVGQRTEVVRGAASAAPPTTVPAAELKQQNNETRPESTVAPSASGSALGSGSSGASTSSGAKDRQPSSTSGSMLTANDLPSSPNDTSGLSARPGVLPSFAVPPQPPVPSCLICDRAIQKTTSNVTLTLHVK